jgi:hypothetical protein
VKSQSDKAKKELSVGKTKSGKRPVKVKMVVGHVRCKPNLADMERVGCTRLSDGKLTLDNAGKELLGQVWQSGKAG